MSKDVVTILMPVYNDAAHLREAIESILVQTYSNFEFLIINDGSTDESIRIIQTFNDKRIRLINHTTNRGVRDRLNEGIALASTELIARMDADDISHPWRLQKQVDYLREHPDCAMVSTLAKVIGEDRNFIQPYDPFKMDTYYGLHFDCYICHPSVMYRKSCVERVGKYTMEFAEDFDLWWKLSRLYKLHVINEPLFLYRIHDHNHSKVHKKLEYLQAEHQIVIRNFHYLLGNDIQIPESFISCYNYDFKLLLEQNDIKETRRCIDLLDSINYHIMAVENPNRNGDAIAYFSAIKKRIVLGGLGLGLPYFKMIQLLWHYKYYQLIIICSLKKIKRNLDIKKRILREIFNGKRKFNIHLLLWNS